LKPFSSNEE